MGSNGLRFKWFGEGGELGRLEGWLTADPVKVEDILWLKKNTIKDREAEIQLQKKKAKASMEKEFNIKLK